MKRKLVKQEELENGGAKCTLLLFVLEKECGSVAEQAVKIMYSGVAKDAKAGDVSIKINDELEFTGDKATALADYPFLAEFLK
jgi:hypothetical protein